MSVDRNRYGALAKLIVDSIEKGGLSSDEFADLVTEQIVRTVASDPAFGQTTRQTADAAVRLANAVEGVAVSLHTIQGVLALDLSARGTLNLKQIEELMGQGIEAYARNAAATKPEGEEHDLPPGVLG